MISLEFPAPEGLPVVAKCGPSPKRGYLAGKDWKGPRTPLGAHGAGTSPSNTGVRDPAEPTVTAQREHQARIDSLA